MSPIVLIDESFGRTRHDFANRTVWLSGHFAERASCDVARIAARQTKDTVGQWLRGLSGHFSIVVKGDGFSFAAVDRVRSYPLIWGLKDGRAVIGHNGPALLGHLGLGPGDTDPSATRAFALSGFTTGNSTLYSDISQIGSGEYLTVSGAGVATARYHRWTPWKPGQRDGEELAALLAELNRKLIDDLISGARGRQIAIPLSAGLDSRLVASGLREAGYDNVLCIAYGQAGNREAVVSQSIALRLGYRWTFVPYTRKTMGYAFHSDDYKRYKSCSDSLTSIHFPQEYLMLETLVRRRELDPDAIFVNGQSGDFIAGNHIPQAFATPELDAAKRLERIVDALIRKHFKNWSRLTTPDRLAEIGARLRREIDSIGGLPDDPAGDHGIYEYCEFYDRQGKYVLNGQRSYEYFGFDWRLPLWDNSYLDFWARVPLGEKLGEALYRKVLERENWANVWRDIPVNPRTIKPGWIVPLRFIAKALHIPLGRDRWHEFEKRFFDYWMADTCAYAAWPWSRIAFDRRGHYSAIAWHIADYLEEKGLRWDGGARR